MTNRTLPDDLFAAIPLPVAHLGTAERIACLRLIRSENIGPVTFRQLINHFGGAQQALDAIPDLARRGGRRAIRLCSNEAAERELAAAAAIDARPLFTIEPGYPIPLASLDHPPPMIYAQGDTSLLNKTAIAIVGSRDCSASGHAFAQRLSSDLSAAGLIVVSGLARGIDGAAHQAALETGTIAVVAGGIDNIYPPEHAGLQREIARRGCIVSEQPPGFKPRGKDFPRRNRIISGLCLGVVIVEAARRSGTLTTARMANEQGREVFAVPGHPLDPRAEGTNSLIKNGATFTTSAEDILVHINPMVDPPSRPHIPETSAGPQPPAKAQSSTMTTDLDQSERAIVERALGPAPTHTDEILRATGLSASKVRIALLELALAGRLEQHGRQLVSLTARPATNA